MSSSSKVTVVKNFDETTYSRVIETAEQASYADQFENEYEDFNESSSDSEASGQCTEVAGQASSLDEFESDINDVQEVFIDVGNT